MTYTIEFSPAAARQLRKLDGPARRRVQAAVELLAQEPRPMGGEETGRRLRGVARPHWRVSAALVDATAGRLSRQGRVITQPSAALAQCLSHGCDDTWE